MSLGSLRLHLRQTSSTNQLAREMAATGVPHGTLVTATEQTAGRGRQGRRWVAPAGRALLCSLLLREPPRLLPLAAGVAVAEVAEDVVSVEASGGAAQIKWPNDVLLSGRKVAGILVEGRPQERWAVLGIGLNVAVRREDLPPELRELAGTLGLPPSSVEPVLEALLDKLTVWLGADEGSVLAAVRERDALLGRAVRWSDREGVGAGIDGDGRLVASTSAGRVALEAGEVHLRREGEGVLPG